MRFDLPEYMVPFGQPRSYSLGLKPELYVPCSVAVEVSDFNFVLLDRFDPNWHFSSCDVC